MWSRFPLCIRKPSKNKLNFIIDKVAAKPTSWKAKSLNKAGRIILINATLQDIPKSYMHMIDFPMIIKNNETLYAVIFSGIAMRIRKEFLESLGKIFVLLRMRGARAGYT